MHELITYYFMLKMQSKSPKRILHVTRIEEGGVARVVEDLVLGFDKDLFEPIVLCTSSVESPFKRRLSNAGVKILSLYDAMPLKIDSKEDNLNNRNIGEKLEKTFNSNIADVYFSIKNFKNFIINQAPEIRLFQKVFRDCKPHLVHTHHNTSMGKAEIVASVLSGLPCISHRHGYKNLTAFDAAFSRLLSGNIYISNDIALSFKSQGESKTKGYIIHNGVDTETFKPIGKSLKIRNEFKIDSNELLVGTVGRIDWWKGHEYFIKAFATVCKHIQNAKALIIGGLETKSSCDRNQRYQKYLKELVKILGVDQKIIFTGHREDIPQLLDSLDVFVHASSEPEPLGLVIIEAMAMRKPVIATAGGGVLDIIENDVNGLLVPLADSDAMSTAILSIILNKKRADKIGFAARQRVKENFSVKKQVKFIEDIYKSIVQEKRLNRASL